MIFLKELPKYADLVRSLSVCKSSLLFDDDEYACERDRILLKFTKMDSIPMKEADRVIEKEDLMRRILIPLCRRRITLQDCKFIQEADSSFVRHYPRIVKDQESAWSVCRTTMPDSQEFCSNKQQRKTNNSTWSNIPSKRLDTNISKARDGTVQGNDSHERSVLDAIFVANKVRRIKAVGSKICLRQKGWIQSSSSDECC